jgi:hypothetical protein
MYDLVLGKDVTALEDFKRVKSEIDELFKSARIPF